MMGIERQSSQGNLLLSQQNKSELSTTAIGRHRNVSGLFGCRTVTACTLTIHSPWLSVFLLHSPGVWHRAEGTPRKGGLKWGPRAMWGAFWGESRGGGWDISLQKKSEKK